VSSRFDDVFAAKVSPEVHAGRRRGRLRLHRGVIALRGCYSSDPGTVRPLKARLC
jgi:hypothetical protein